MTKDPNAFINIFYCNGNIYRSSVTISHDNFSRISGLKPIDCHLSYDLQSSYIYVIYHRDKDSLKDALTRVKEEFDLKISNIIFGSPFSTIRIRSSKCFQSLKNIFIENFGEYPEINVVELNLNRMPKLKDELKISGYFQFFTDLNTEVYDEYYTSGEKRKKPQKVCDLIGDFLIIDISKENNVNSVEKEWAVLSACHQKLSIDGIINGLDSFRDLYAIKTKLNMGYTVEEVCSLFIGQMDLDFPEMMKAVNLIGRCISKKIYNYYYFFEFSSEIPFNLRENSLGNNFEILYVNKKQKLCLINSFAYIPQGMLVKNFKLKKEPLIFFKNEIKKTCDIKTSSESYSYYKHIFKKNVGKYFEEYDFICNEMSRSNSSCNSIFFTVRNLKSYPYVHEFLKKSCKSQGFPFVDIPILVGPIERIFGLGTQGGFISEKQFIDSKTDLPLKINDDISIMPPFIAINSITKPDYSAHNSTLIHEYQHFIFSKFNPGYEHQYNKPENESLKEKDPDKYWDLYLNDPDEKQAHSHQVIYEIGMGKSVDEIIRDKVGGEINLKNYKTALLFKRIINEALQNK